MHECPTCGDTFEARRGLGVHHVHAHDERLPNRTCAACGTEFFENYAKKYCSEECHDESVSYEGESNPHYQGKKQTTDCEICGDSFEYWPSEKPGLYCPECVENQRWRYRPILTGEDNHRWGGGKTRTSCVVCGESVERYPNQLEKKEPVCSLECRSKLVSDSFTGEGHPNWKGGGYGPYGKGWGRVRREALDRDNYTCQVCGLTKEEIGRNPDVHHIVPVREFIESEELDREDAHSLDNVITLCVTCHRRADYGNIPPSELRSLFEVEAP